MKALTTFIAAVVVSLFVVSCSNNRTQIPGSTTPVSPDLKTINVIDYELRMRPAKVGDRKSVAFNASLDGIRSAAVQVTGFDLDGVTEAEMFINNHKVILPPEIVADMQPRTVTIELNEGILLEGKNRVTFLFADAVGGTTGFSITGVKILLRKSDVIIVDVLDSELRMKPVKVGDKRTVIFDLVLKQSKSEAIQVTGFDIDGPTEAEMFLNGRKINLPADIVADMMKKTVTVELEKGILRNGKNEMTFVFADAVGGTTGFSISDVKVLIRN